MREDELRQQFKGISEEAFTNTARIAESCNIELAFCHPKFDKYLVDDSIQYLRTLAENGFQKRCRKSSSEHRTRFEYELNWKRYRLNGVTSHDFRFLRMLDKALPNICDSLIA
jgi:DNA polymerase III alpha subunit